MDKDNEMVNSTTDQDNEDVTSENNEENLDSETQDEEADAAPSQEKEVGKDLEELNRQLYSRAKNAEKELKSLRAKNEAIKKSPKQDGVDFFELTKTVQALRDFTDEQELDLVRRQAQSLGVSLADAALHEDTQVLVNHYRAKKKNVEAIPEPSSRRPVYEKPFEQWAPTDLDKLIDDGSDASMKKIDEYYRWAKNN